MRLRNPFCVHAALGVCVAVEGVVMCVWEGGGEENECYYDVGDRFICGGVCYLTFYWRFCWFVHFGRVILWKKNEHVS